MKKNVCPETAPDENQFRGSLPRLPYLLVLLVPFFIYCTILSVLKCSSGNWHFIIKYNGGGNKNLRHTAWRDGRAASPTTAPRSAPRTDTTTAAPARAPSSPPEVRRRKVEGAQPGGLQNEHDGATVS